MITIGTTYEGRDIHALRVGVSPSLSQEPSEQRKTIIISGGFHAREWISVSTVTYIAWSLITSYGKAPGITKLLQEFDFVLHTNCQSRWVCLHVGEWPLMAEESPANWSPFLPWCRPRPSLWIWVEWKLIFKQSHAQKAIQAPNLFKQSNPSA